MTKHRLYNSKMRPSGTIQVEGDMQFLGLQFRGNSDLAHRFRVLVAGFLDKEQLKIVNGKTSLKQHDRSVTPDAGLKGFDIYHKTSRMRDGKIKLKKYSANVESKNIKTTSLEVEDGR